MKKLLNAAMMVISTITIVILVSLVPSRLSHDDTPEPQPHSVVVYSENRACFEVERLSSGPNPRYRIDDVDRETNVASQSVSTDDLNKTKFPSNPKWENLPGNSTHIDPTSDTGMGRPTPHHAS